MMERTEVYQDPITQNDVAYDGKMVAKHRSPLPRPKSFWGIVPHTLLIFIHQNILLNFPDCFR